MIGLLCRIFIPDYKNYKNAEVRSAYGTLCGIVGIFLNICLFAAKLTAGILSGSISVIADAFNNISDAGSSLITLIGFRLAGQKPDISHPFGHGRIEYISGLLVSILIVIMGFELGKSSVERILSPEPTQSGILTVAILSVSILVKLYMSIYNRRVGKKIDSAAMLATATDSISDCVSTGVVLACTLFTYFTHVEIDAYCGLAVSVFVMIAGIRAVKETISPLLGQPPTQEFVQEVEKIVRSKPIVAGIHDLVVHDYGPGRRMISLHAEVPGDCNIYETHDAIDNLEQELKNKLFCEAVIHMDPVSVGDEETDKAKSEVLAKLHEIDARITVHDFRIVAGPTHTNLIFDAVVPFDVKGTEEELGERIKQKVSESGEHRFAVFKIDRTYVL